MKDTDDVPVRRGDIMITGRMAAAMAILQRTGARSAEVAFDDDGFVMPVVWRASANFDGHRVYSFEHPYPSGAAEDLIGKVMNGGTCKRCNRTMVVGINVPGYCSFILHADDVDDEKTYRYVRTCESDPW